MMTMTRTEESTAVATAVAPTLLLAFELGERTWKLGFTTGLGQRPRMRQIPARATDRVLEEITRAQVRFKVPANARTLSCYEAGREGFWLHRWLVAHAVSNHVIDSSSIEVNRRARRVKTDRLDLGGLLNLLARSQQGDRQVWRGARAERGRGGCAAAASDAGDRPTGSESADQSLERADDDAGAHAAGRCGFPDAAQDGAAVGWDADPRRAQSPCAC
jgi:hypothetical protein